MDAANGSKLKIKKNPARALGILREKGQAAERLVCAKCGEGKGSAACCAAPSK